MVNYHKSCLILTILTNLYQRGKVHGKVHGKVDFVPKSARNQGDGKVMVKTVEITINC